MISLDGPSEHFLCLIQFLQSDPIFLIKIGVFHIDNLAIDILARGIPSEPFRFFRNNHSVFTKLNQQRLIEGSQLCGSSGILLGLLVVKIGQENVLLQISLILAGSFEVGSGTEMFLHQTGVDKLISHPVDYLAESTTGASRNGGNTLMRSTKCDHFGHSTLKFALLDDITSDKTSMRETNDVEFALQIFICLNGGAGFFDLCVEIGGEGGNEFSITEAYGVCTGLVTNMFGELLHTGVETGVTHTMEHGGGKSIFSCGESNITAIVGVFQRHKGLSANHEGQQQHNHRFHDFFVFQESYWGDY
mmetsp:Transcript_5472/g.6015  ORF Transcript_5472/g.6015 Transcript_5472/m.6015 type:complete len:304 (+) Transcript_5472:1289-2200(+)